MAMPKYGLEGMVNPPPGNGHFPHLQILRIY